LKQTFTYCKEFPGYLSNSYCPAYTVPLTGIQTMIVGGYMNT